MGYNHAYTAYQKMSITTASQGHLIVLLYEAAVRNLSGASAMIGADGKIKVQEIEKFGALIQKAQSIITELQVSLDMEKGGELSKNLMSLYIYFNSELTDATIKHDKKKIDFVCDMLRQLLDSWKAASNSTANAPAETPVPHAGVNIEG